MFFEHAISVLGLALLFEHFWGNPSSPWYPAHSFVGFADTIQSLLWKNSRLRGFFAWTLTILASLSVFVTIWYHLAFGTTWPSIILQSLLLWISLSWKSFTLEFEHTVSEAQPNAPNVSTQKLSLAIIAPLFYFTFFGVLGAWAYRMTNILAECWNISEEKHVRFGWFANKISRTLNFLPLQLTGLFSSLLSNLESSSISTQATRKKNIHTINSILILMILCMLSAAWAWNHLS